MAAGGGNGPIKQDGVQEDLQIIQAYEQALSSLSGPIDKDNQALSQLSTQIKNFNASIKGYQKTYESLSNLLHPYININKDVADYINWLGKIQDKLDTITTPDKLEYLAKLVNPTINKKTTEYLTQYKELLSTIQPLLENNDTAALNNYIDVLGELPKQLDKLANPDSLKYLAKALSPTINANTIKYLTDYRDILGTLQPVLETNATAMLNYTTQLTNFKNELKGIVGLNKNGKLNLGFNYSVNQKENKTGTVLPNGDTVEGKPKKSSKGKSQEDIIEGHFRDLTRQILSGNDIIQKETAKKWNSVAGSVLGTIASNSGNRYLISAASLFKKGTEIKQNRERKRRYEELAAEGLKISQTATSEKVKEAAAGTSAAASSAAQGSGALATAGTIGLVVAAVLAFAAACAAVEIASKKATERNVRLAQSMKIMGESMTSASEKALNTRKKEIELANMWENTLNSVQDAFSGVHEVVIGFLTDILSLTGASKKESLEKQYTSQAEISARAQQSGFNVGSANVLALGTYGLADKYTAKFGKTTSKLAKDLSDAWLSGSDAAKEYGVVVDDLTLIGYTASKGIDIVNVEISDAMRQYYRFQLMQEELNRTSDEGMSQQIRSWKQYGQLIDSTKQKLFSFDEVIQLTAVDTTIPDLGRASLNETFDKTFTNPTLPPSDLGGFGGISFKPLEGVTGALGGLPEEVAGLNEELDKIPEKVPQVAYAFQRLGNAVNTDVNPALAGMKDELDKIPSTVPVRVGVAVQGKEQVNELINTCIEATKPWEAQLRTTVPQYDLIVDTLNKYRTLDGTDWQAQLNLITLGQETIDQAYDSLVQTQGQYYADVIFKVSGLSELQKAVALARELNGMKSGAYSSVWSSQANKAISGNKSISSLTSAAGASTGHAMASKEEILNRAFHPVTSSVLSGSYNKKTNANEKIAQSYMKESALQAASTYNKSDPILTIINNYKANNSTSNQKFESMKEAYIPSNYPSKHQEPKSVISDVFGASKYSEAMLQSTLYGVAAAALAQFANAPRFASGGIGTKESLISAFEGDKAEAVIPLESQQGVDYLANALQQAGAGDGGGSSSVVVNVNLSGLNLADNDAQWERVGRKISEVIEIQTQRRGKLSYGSK
jgi:hypothetical protein